MTDYPWSFRCSICKKLVNPDDVRSHTEQERAKPTWPGQMTWDRVDQPAPREGTDD